MNNVLVINDNDKRTKIIIEYLAKKEDLKLIVEDEEVNFKKNVLDVEYIVIPTVFLNINYAIKNTNIILNVKNIKILKGKTLICGITNSEFRKRCLDNGVKLVEMFQDDKLVIENAVLTSEAILSILIERMDISLNKANIIIFGYGRVGIVLGNMLKTLKANITIVARNAKDIVFALSNNLNVINLACLSSKDLRKYDALINTIPQKNIINQQIISNLKSDIKIIDISSSPGGVDFEYTKSLGIDATLEPSLPARYSYKSAGELLGEKISDIIK